MAADRQATVRISADGAQVVTTYEAIGQSATQAGQRIEAATAAANSSSGRFAQGLSNAFGTARKNVANLSFQLQDVAVQLQGGANPLTVLVQQGTQIASVFGPAGAVVGAVGAGLGLMAGYFLSAADDAETAKEETYNFGDALSFLGDTAVATAGEIAKLTGEYRKASAASQELTRLNLERQQRELEAQLEGSRGQASQLLGQLPSQRFETVTGGFLVEGRPQAYEDTIQANIDAVRKFAESGSLVGAARDLDQLAKRAEEAGNTELRDLANRLLDVASAGAETEAQLQTVGDQIQALAGATGEGSQGFPVSLQRQFGPDADKPARAPSSRGARSAEAAAKKAAADTARAAKIEAAEEKRRYELVVEQINDGADAKYAADVAAAERRRDFTLQTLAEEEERLKKNPAEYYRLTGDTDLASTYNPLVGAADAFRKLSDESQQYGKIIGDSIAAGAQVASQAISAFVLEGKSGIADLAKTVADQLLTGALSIFINGIVGAGGSALTNYLAGPSTAGATGASPLTYGGPRAAGGPVRGDRWYWVGENGPERFVPDGAGQVEPMGRGGGGGGTTVQVIDQRGQNAPPVETQRSTGPDGREQIRLIVRAEVNQALASGAHDKALRGRFGMKPALQR
jgi:hypothetical protein